MEEVLNKTLTEIKMWLVHEKPELHFYLKNRLLISFLHGCGFEVELTKAKILNYYSLKLNAFPWFTNRDPKLKEIQEILNLGVFIPLKITYQNKLVFIVKVGAYNPRVHKQDDVVKTGMMVLDMAAKENERNQIIGCIAIFDMAGLTVAHGTEITPSVIQKLVFTWQNYHIQPEYLAFVNAPVYLSVVLNIFKSFMGRELKECVRVDFAGTKSLHRFIDLNILPPEYGGNGESLDLLVTFWNEKLMDHQEWFLNNEKLFKQ